MADTSTNGEPCVLNHFIEDFIIQESSWPFTVSIEKPLSTFCTVNIYIFQSGATFFEPKLQSFFVYFFI